MHVDFGVVTWGKGSIWKESQTHTNTHAHTHTHTHTHTYIYIYILCMFVISYKWRSKKTV